MSSIEQRLQSSTSSSQRAHLMGAVFPYLNNAELTSADEPLAVPSVPVISTPLIILTQLLLTHPPAVTYAKMSPVCWSIASGAPAIHEVLVTFETLESTSLSVVCL